MSDYFSTIPFALVISQLIVSSVYSNSDKFFTKVSQAALKNLILMSIEAFLFIISLVCGLIEKPTEISDGSKPVRPLCMRISRT